MKIRLVDFINNGLNWILTAFYLHFSVLPHGMAGFRLAGTRLSNAAAFYYYLVPCFSHERHMAAAA